jgi:hypothetical protein
MKLSIKVFHILHDLWLQNHKAKYGELNCGQDITT